MLALKDSTDVIDMMAKVFPKVDPGTVAELQRVRADLAEKGNLSVHYETFRNITKHFHSGLIGGGSSSDESGSAHSTGKVHELVFLQLISINVFFFIPPDEFLYHFFSL